MSELEQATIVARAIHTLEWLRNSGLVKNDDSVPSLFAAQSYDELQRLAAHYAAQGITPSRIDIGGYINGDPGVYADFERARMTEWNSGRPIKVKVQP